MGRHDFGWHIVDASLWLVPNRVRIVAKFFHLICGGHSGCTSDTKGLIDGVHIMQQPRVADHVHSGRCVQQEPAARDCSGVGLLKCMLASCEVYSGLRIYS
jgi:hypothetical protein